MEYKQLPTEKIIGEFYMMKDEKLKLVVRSKASLKDVKLSFNGLTLDDAFNDREPYDPRTHVYYIDPEGLTPETEFACYGRDKAGELFGYEFKLGSPRLYTEEELIPEYDSRITPYARTEEEICEGVRYIHLSCRDKSEAPVEAYMLEVDTKRHRIAVGTPNDGYVAVNVSATIPEMMLSAIEAGRDVIASVNGDFFDMFGDLSPSGLCIKDGRVVANPESRRAFVGMKKSGEVVLTDIAEYPDAKEELDCCFSGYQMVLRDGELYDVAPLEPFSFVRHPRTAVGLRKDGTLLLLVVDGRLPEYSNGASLVDLARIMQSFSADRAINIDGGGSSVMFTRRDDGELRLHNRPADLHRPTEMLIRSEYNCLMVLR